MTETTSETLLRRKLEAGAPDPALAVSAPPTVEKALGLAMARVSDRLLTLAVTARETSQATRSLAELLDELPENGLIAVLEGPQEAQGVMVLEAALLAALVEQQTAGGLSPRAGAGASRRPTRTDAALCADWIDAVLGALGEGFAEAPEASWLTGFGFSCHLPDARPLGLMLEDEPYRVLSFALDLASGARQGAGKLILPAAGRGARPHPAHPPGPGPAPGPAAAPERPDWGARMQAQLMEAEVTLRAVLHRGERSIEQILALQPGALIALPEAGLDGLRLEAGDGHVVARGKLGQSGGLRAVRLSDGAREAAADPLGRAMERSGADGPALPEALEEMLEGGGSAVTREPGALVGAQAPARPHDLRGQPGDPGPHAVPEEAPPPAAPDHDARGEPPLDIAGMTGT